MVMTLRGQTLTENNLLVFYDNVLTFLVVFPRKGHDIVLLHYHVTIVTISQWKRLCLQLCHCRHDRFTKNTAIILYCRFLVLVHVYSGGPLPWITNIKTLVNKYHPDELF